MGIYQGGLIVIDARVLSYQHLVDGLAVGTKVLVLSPDHDGIEQITKAIAALKSVQSLYILSHGSPGCIELGASNLGLDNIEEYTRELASWFVGIANPQIMLYSCNVAKGDAGAEFIEKLQTITSATVAASTTLIGNAVLGGNWHLDYPIAEITSEIPITAQVLKSYAGVLNTSPTINGTASWTIAEDTLLALNTLNIVDPDSSDTQTVTLSVSQGTLSLGTTSGLTGYSSPANSISFSGLLTDINNALSSLNYSPTLDYNGTDTLAVSVSDGTDSTSTNVTITIDPVNDAPVLNPAVSPLLVLSTIDEDALPVGDLVSDFVGNISDVDAGAVKGIAITGVSSQGTLYYSLDNGTTWNQITGLSDASALLLASDSNTRIFFKPNTNFNGTITDALTFRAWDQSSGLNGDTANTTINGITTAFSTATDSISITIDAVNDAPIRTDNNPVTLGSVAEESSSILGGTISSLFASKFNDIADNVIGGSTADDFAGIAVVGNGASSFEGLWQWSLDGSTWFDINSSIDLSTTLLLNKDSKLRFSPALDFNGTPGGLTIRLFDDSKAFNIGDVIDLSAAEATGNTTPYSDSNNEVILNTFVTAVNDAPTVVDGDPVTLTSVLEDTTNPTGETVFNLFSPKFSDSSDQYSYYGGSSADSLAGVAIVANKTTNVQGVWQWSLDGTTWTDIATDLSNNNALVLNQGTKIRFKSANDFNGTPGTLTARLIDNSQGVVTSGNSLDFSLVTSGGSTQYSTSDNTVVLGTSVTSVNDAPTRDITKLDLEILAQEDTFGSSSYTVETLFGAGFQDIADQQAGNGGVSVANTFAGVAIVQNEATSTQGIWQWLNGTTWQNIATNLSTSNALILDKNTQVRFIITTPNYNGQVGKLTASLIDDSLGSVTSGTVVDLTTNGGNTVYSNSSNQVRVYGSLTPINDAPTINPIALSVNEGGSAFFTNTGNVNLVDIDNQDVQLIIRIRSLPTSGYLTLNGSKLVVDSTFSADQISLLKYTHDNSNGVQVLSNLADSFGITAEDGAGGVLGTPTSPVFVPIIIKPVDELPTVTNGTRTLYEGETGVTFPIGITDPDQASGTPYNIEILSLPVRGTLKYNGSAITVNSSISSSNLNLLTYDHDGNDLNNGNPPNESFQIKVTDDGGGTGIPQSVNQTITLNVVPNNDDPTLTNNTGTTLNTSTGREITVTTAMLQVSDPDSSNTQLTYTLTDLPDHGFLLYNDNGTLKKMLVGASFTQEDLNTGIIRYRFFESGTGTFNDDFKFQVRDSEIRSWPSIREGGIWKADGSALDTLTFNLTIETDTPRGSGPGEGVSFPDRGLNTPPVISNNGVVLNEAGTVTITNSLLQATDSDTPTSGVVFRISDLPTTGTLRLNGSAVQIGGSFTQADVDSGFLTFEHAGDEKFTDKFGFTLSDGSNVVSNGASPFYFNIDVTPQNDAPNIDVKRSPFLAEAGTINITKDDISLSDVDGSGEKSGIGYAAVNNLTFQVIDLPTSGYLEVNQGSGYVQITAANKNSINITSAQLNSNQLRYVHNGSENYLDNFKVQVNDNTPGTTNNLSAIKTVNLEIAPLNDNPTLQTKKALTVTEGQQGTIKGSNGLAGDEARLVYQDPDNSTIQRQYFITDYVKYGTLFLNGAALGQGSIFSQADLDNNRITYKHDGSENHLDSFNYQVRDGGGDNVPGTYDINIVPLNDAPTLNVPGTQTSNSTNPLPITGITISDIDLVNVDSSGEINQIRVTLEAQLVAGTTYANGRLNLPTTTGITFINPATGLAYTGATNNNVYGNKLIIEGTAANVQAALNSLQYQINTDLNSTIALNITVDDRIYVNGVFDNRANGGLSNQDNLAFSDLNNTVTKTVLINSSSVNDAPVISISNNSSSAFLREDTTVPFNGKGNNPGQISIIDVDAFDTINTVTLTVTKGNIFLADPTLLTGGANNSQTFTLTGSIAAINKALQGLSYQSDPNYNNYRGTGSVTLTDSLTIVVNDQGNTGTGGPQEITRKVNLVISPVNDAPTRLDPNPITLTVAEDTVNPPGDTVFNIFNPKFNDIIDNQTASNGSLANNFAGVALVQNTVTNTSQGRWQWSLNGTTWTNISTGVSIGAALLLSPTTRVRFIPSGNFHGTVSGSLTARLIDTSSSAVTSGTVLNLSGSTATGGITRYSDSNNTVLVQSTISPVNDAPTATISTVTVPATVAEDTTPSGVSLSGLVNSKYTDPLDNQTTNGGGNTSTPLSYIAIVGSTNYVAGQGTWQVSDGAGGWINIPVSGLVNINNATTPSVALVVPSDRELRFVSAANFFGTPGNLLVRLADNSVPLSISTSSTDTKFLKVGGAIGDVLANGGVLSGVIGGTGSWSVQTVTIASNPITNVNDAPTINNPFIAATLTNIDEDATSIPGATVSTLFSGKHRDTIDDQSSITGGGKADTSLAGIAITGNAANSVTQGVWQYNTGSGWVDVPASGLSDSAALVLTTTAQLRFVPIANYYGIPGQLTVRLSDGTLLTAGTGQDLTSNIGGTGGWSFDTTNLTTTINSVNDAPILTGTGTNAFTENASPIPVGLGLTAISDIEIGLTQVSDLVSATVTIGNFFTGDLLGFNFGSTGVTATPNATGNIYTLSGSSLANILAVLQSTTYSSTNDNLTDSGTKPTRSINYQINDTQTANNLSNIVSETVTITALNDAPSLANTSFTINEDPTTNNGQTINSLFTGKFTDPDGPTASLSGLAIVGNTANATTQGTWQYSTDGTNWYGIGTVNDTTNALTLSSSTKIRFSPVLDYNGTPPALTVRALDDTYNLGFTSGATRFTINTSTNGDTTPIASTPTNLTAVVNPVNDPPVIIGVTGTRSYTENTAAILLVTSGTGSDVDATNFNNGNITVAFTSYQAGDLLSVNTAGLISLVGNSVRYNGTEIGVTTGGNGSNLVINLNTQATQGAVQELLNNLTYVNTGDDPTVAGAATQRAFNVTLNDGGNVGSGGPKTSNILAGTIDITAINDAPLNTVPATQTTLEDTTRVFSSGNGNLIAISDVDAGNKPVTVTLAATNGSITLSGTNGLTFTAGDGTLDPNITVTGTISNINAALNGLSFAPNSNYNNNYVTGPGSITITTNDLGNTGNGGASTDSDTIIVNITPVNDAPVLLSTGITGSYTEGLTPSNIGTNLTSISDIEVGANEPNVANLFTGTVNITNFFTGDLLNFNVGSTGITINSQGNGAYTLTGSTRDNILQVLQSATYSSTSPNPTNYGTSTSRTITFQVDDNQGVNNLSNIVSSTVNITPKNDPPTVTTSIGATTFTEGNNVTSTPVVIDSGLTLNDVDNLTLSSATVSITGGLQTAEDVLTFNNNNATLYGNITSTYNSTTGQLTLTSAGQTATLTQWQNALQVVNYTNSSENPNSSDRTVSIRLNDGTDNSLVSTKIVKVVPVNDTPILGAGSTVNYTENAAATPIAGSMTLTNIDTATYNNGSSLTVAYNSGATTADQLSISAGNGITVSGNVVSYGGNAIGTFTGGSNGTGLTITFNGTGSSAVAVKQLLNNISFSNTSEDPVSGNRVFQLTINDNEGGLQTAISTTTVNVIPVNDKSTLTSTALNPNYIEDTVTASTLFNGSATSTIEAGQAINQLQLTVSNLSNSTAETLSIDGMTVILTNGATFTGTTNGFSGSVSVTGGVATVTVNKTGATPAQIDSLVNGLGYKNTSQDPTAGNRTITITSLTDNGGTSNGGQDISNPNLVSIVNVIPVNDAPTLTATGNTTSYTEDTVTATTLFSGAATGTIEAAQKLNQLQLTVTNLSDGSAETLSIDGTILTLTNGATFTGTTNGFSGSVSVTGSVATLIINNTSGATTAQLSGLVNGLGYKNTSQAPTAGVRTITLTSLTDNGGISNGGQDTKALSIAATVNIIPVNDAPVLNTAFNPSITVVEDAAVPVGAVGYLISDFVGGISDVDANPLNGIAITAGSTRGILYYSTNGGTSWTSFTPSATASILLANDANTRIFFQPNANLNGTVPTDITFRAWDRTTGTNGSTVNTSTNGLTTAFSAVTDTISVTITPVNDAPIATGSSTLTTVVEDTSAPAGQTIGTLFSSNFGDATDNQTALGGSSANTLAGVAITTNAAAASQGVWQWLNGATWTDIIGVSTTTALVLNTSTLVRFLPIGNFNGTPGNLTVKLIDNSSGAVTSGTSVNVTTSGGITQYSSNAVTLTTSISAVNDAPIATGSATLTAINEDTTSPTGASVTALFTTNFNDSTDQVTGGSTANTLAGVAIVGNTANASTQGSWQYYNGTSWTDVGTRSDSSALTVAAANNLRFVPVANYHGIAPALTVRLIDSSTTVITGSTVNVTTNGGITAYSAATVALNSSVTPVNDAPTATGSVTITSVTEDTTSPTGTTINGLITSSNYSDSTDNQTGKGGGTTETAFSNIAVVGSSNYVAGQGSWQYSNGSGGWINIPVSGLSETAALIIPAGRDIRFVSAADFFGTPGTLNVRLADSSTSLTASTSSSDTKNLSTNGVVGGIGAWSSETISISSSAITNVNDAPTINNAATPASLTNVNEDNSNPSGDLVSNLFGAKYNDSIDNQTGITGGGNAVTPLAGIAITGNAASSVTQGFWQYNTGSGWVSIPTSGLSDSAALVIPATAQLRFLANAEFNGTPGQLTVRLSDGAGFVTGTGQNISSNLGGINGYSSQTTTLTTSISAVNDAPIATGSATLTATNEDTISPTGASVTALFTTNFNDSTDQVTNGSTANTLAGVAIVGNTANASTQGSWQYYNGTSWTDVGTRSDSSALTVAAANNLRFVPVPNYNGIAPALTVRLIDSSTTVTTGSTVNVTTNGGTTAYSAATVALNSSVTPVNDTPALAVPGLQTLGTGTSLVFNTTKGNAITIDDAFDLLYVPTGGATDDFTVTLTATNSGSLYGSLTVATGSGATVTGDNTSTVTLTGTKAQINNALNGLSYLPVNPNAELSINLNIKVDDKANGGTAVSGVGGALGVQNNITINISNINEAPIVTNPVSVIATEDTPLTFGNSISFTDSDDFGNDLQVTLSALKGTLSLSATQLALLTSYSGNGTNNVTLRGSESVLNNTLATLNYLGNLNYNTLGTSKDTLTIKVDDLGNTGNLVSTGLPGSNIITKTVDISVTPVNDAPLAIGIGPVASILEDDANPVGSLISTLLSSKYSDVADTVVGGTTATQLMGIAITANAAPSTEGKWQYATTSSSTTWLDIPTALSTSSALVLNASAKLRFLPAANFNGSPGQLTAYLSDGLGFVAGTGQNISSNLGGANGWSLNGIPITSTITAVNDPPVINNLDGDYFNYRLDTLTGQPIIVDQIPDTGLASIYDVEGLKNTGVLTISLDGLGIGTGDKLGINLGSNISLSGSNVSINGTLIGTIDSTNNGTNGKPLSILFNANVSNSLATTLIQNITYTDSTPTTTGLRVLKFTVTDGEGGKSNEATALINVSPLQVIYAPLINGSDRAEILGNNTVTPNNDVIHGRGANDILYGYGGDDLLFGDDGNDQIDGGSGNDALLGGIGIDNLLGGTGEDVLLGQGGNDIFNGGDGNDYLDGGEGVDSLTGGLGIDRFNYRNLTDSLITGFDVIKDFSLVTDLLVVSKKPDLLTNVGAVTALTEAGITTKLNTTNFTANNAAQFTYGSSRSFIAINDGTAGFQATTDAIIEVTGLTGASVFNPNNFTLF